MAETLKTVLGMMLLLFQSRSRLQVEILVLRQQLIVLRGAAPKRVRLRVVDRMLFMLLYRLWPRVLDLIAVIQPDTIVRAGTDVASKPYGGGGPDAVWGDLA